MYPHKTWASLAAQSLRDSGQQPAPARSHLPEGSVSPTLLVLCDIALCGIQGHRQIVIRRQPDYAATIAAITSARTLTGLKEISFHLRARIPEYGPDTSEITEDVWPDIVFTLTSVMVAKDNVMSPSSAQAVAYGIMPESTLHSSLTLRGGKPVIYIRSPDTLDNVSVSLSLTSSWSFSALYPSADIVHEDGTETIQWIVRTSPDGTLLDKRTGLQVSYLFWEAETHPAELLTPASSRPSSPDCHEVELFDPSRPVITPRDAVLLSIDKVPAYLDEALKALTLHTEARTSFITYWLPSLLKHEHVALKFLPQEAYEAAAPMNVVPIPDVTTRVFMLFRGVEEKDLVEWSEAHQRASDDISFWTKVVGVDAEKALNKDLYGVLEWGGMEVK